MKTKALLFVRLRALIRQRVFFIITASGLACAICTSCAIIPTDYYDSNFRKNVSEETTEIYLVGKPTKLDVYLTLGEPDGVSADGRCLFYRWEKIKVIWFIVLPPSFAAGGEYYKKYAFAIFFDENGYFLRSEFTSSPLLP
jgi:hypothetical protein